MRIHEDPLYKVLKKVSYFYLLFYQSFHEILYTKGNILFYSLRPQKSYTWSQYTIKYMCVKSIYGFYSPMNP